MSSRSRASTTFSRASSLIRLKKAGVAAELAAKEAEFNALQEQARHKEETARMEAALACRKAELEQMEVRKQMEMERARLMVYQEVEEAEENVGPTEDDLLQIPPTQSEPKTTSTPFHQSPPVEHSTEVSANASRTEPQPIPLRSQGVNLPPTHGREINQQSCYSQEFTPKADTTAAIIAAITDSVIVSPLPVPEPNVFNGEPIKYPDWKSSFRALIDRRNLPSSDKMYYLKRYVSGSAREAISGLFLLNSQEAYERAWDILDERFGHPFIISKAYRYKLQRWPKIGTRDHQSLRKFADFLSRVKTAMHVVQGLDVLNDYVENQKLLLKLPDWLISRWNRIANKHLREDNTYPGFKMFVTFIITEAELACNPIFSCNAVKEAEMLENVRTGQRTKDAKENRNTFSIKTNEEDAKESNGIENQQFKCTFCKKTDHQLDGCSKFKFETLATRMTFVKENRFCFGCLKRGHASKDCRRRLNCSTCNKKHPTCLHEDRSIQAKKEERKVGDSACVPESTS